MTIIQKSVEAYVLRFDRGEELIASLINFAKTKDITGAFFYGLGGATEVTLAHYDLDAKEYKGESFRGNLEIASLTGNVAKKDGEAVIHAHTVIGLEDKSARAGHVQKLIIAGTCELSLYPTEEPLTRTYDDETGLWLLEPVSNHDN